ncbi:hypothetical protein JTB14_011594 [Gonioctena quinquepunctata]|nr:hypothetical protein JTB14_011594 [Gonioctena quinquepunctata]
MERQFDKKLCHVRVTIEHTFGIMKQKFRQLYHLKLRDMTVIRHFIRACVLHNLSREEEDTEEMQQVEENVNMQVMEEHVNEENEGSPSGLLFSNYLAARFFNE